MKALFISNNSAGMYLFRREIVEAVGRSAEVYLCTPKGRYLDFWESIGCTHIEYEFESHGTNPMQELKQISFYKSILKSLQPDIVFTYTIKPNIYGGIACKQYHIPYIANISGLGDVLENGGVLRILSCEIFKGDSDSGRLSCRECELFCCQDDCIAGWTSRNG